MISDPESIAAALRPLAGVKDVDVVRLEPEKELWVVLREPVNFNKLSKTSESLGYVVERRGSWVSKLPRSLAEMIWDGVTYIVTKHTQSRGKKEYAARVMKDLATGDTIYHIMAMDGLEILKEYLKT